jgi:hypothetical protein
MEQGSKHFCKSGSQIFWLARKKVDQYFLALLVALTSDWCSRFISPSCHSVCPKHKGRYKTMERKILNLKTDCYDLQLTLILTSFDVICHFLNAASDEVRLPEPQSPILNTKWEIHKQLTFFHNYWQKGPIF